METPVGHDLNADQIAYWNGPGGQRWADRQQSQDILLAPIADLLIDRARPAAGRADHRRRLRQRRDLDCAGAEGCADRARDRHRHIRSDAGAARASSRRRDLPVEFALADATVYPFDPASFDLLASRFGVMFFAEPALLLRQPAPGAAAVGPAGLRLLARAARKSVLHGAAAGRLQARSQAAAAGARRSRSVRVSPPKQRVQRILSEAGFTGIAMEPCNLSLDIAIGRGLDAAVKARSKSDRPPRARRAAAGGASPPPPISMREVLAPFLKGDSVPLPASIWIVTARAPERSCVGAISYANAVSDFA